jgi:hypothetical protein
VARREFWRLPQVGARSRAARQHRPWTAAPGRRSRYLFKCRRSGGPGSRTGRSAAWSHSGTGPPW